MQIGRSQIRELAVLAIYSSLIDPQLDPKACFNHLIANVNELEEKFQYKEINEEEFDQLKAKGLPFHSTSSVQTPKSRFDQVKKVSEDEEVTPPAYFVELIEGVRQHQEAIDQQLNNHITGKWSVKRLESINLAILRIAAYEILYGNQEKIPAVVAIDEAVELAKRYSDEKSRRFINGVLSALLVQ